ncbi:MAG: hypothetical protein HY788_22745 [Deltaproteobacteria bacterium]|nr:hypothetical protein [Deltaproteobacteria bacterium]
MMVNKAPRKAGNGASLGEDGQSTYFLNCYEISNADSLSWDVAVYRVKKVDGQPSPHDERGELKSLFWDFKRGEFKSVCGGYGFIIDVDDDAIAIPGKWAIPEGIERNGYVINRANRFTACAANPGHRAVVAGIIREGLRKHFKEHTPEGVGDLWQDYGGFCQMPSEVGQDEYCFCRRFNIAAKVMSQNRWVVEFVINTATLDGRTIGDYYAGGSVAELVEMIGAKQANRLNRENRQTAVRIWLDRSVGTLKRAEVLELCEPESFVNHSNLSQDEQKKLTGITMKCRRFKGNPIEIPITNVRLILDTQITQEDHSQTIIDPADRVHLMKLLRDFTDGADLYEQRMSLAESPFSAKHFPHLLIAPPAIRVRDKDGGESVLGVDAVVSNQALQDRARRRLNHVRKFGFLEQRPLFPLLACPQDFGKDRASRMKYDLNRILKDLGIGIGLKRGYSMTMLKRSARKLKRISLTLWWQSFLKDRRAPKNRMTLTSRLSNAFRFRRSAYKLITLCQSTGRQSQQDNFKPVTVALPIGSRIVTSCVSSICSQNTTGYHFPLRIPSTTILTLG